MKDLQDVSTKFTSYKDLFEEFLNRPTIKFAELKPSMLPDCPGVYAIYENISNRCLYVGRAVNLQRRIYTNHLHGNSSTVRLKNI
jgi:GIY-YIG catalytic domain